MSLNNKTKSPCIGVCSTGIGDSVCRGCKRFTHEVIYWNAYSEAQRSTIAHRLNSLLAQVVAGKIAVFDKQALKEQLEYQGLDFDKSVDPHCWVFKLLQAGASQITDLAKFGCVAQHGYENTSLKKIKSLIDRDFYTLSTVHYERYFEHVAE